MSIVVVSAVSQKRKVIIQSQLQPEPQQHKYCSNGQKPELYRSEARTSQIASRLIQARSAGEKRLSQRVFCFHLIIFNSRAKGCFISFLLNIQTRVLSVSFDYLTFEPKKVFISFLEELSKQIFLSEFFLLCSITFIPEVKEFKNCLLEPLKSQYQSRSLLLLPS